VAQQLPANFVKDDAIRMNLNLLLLSLCGILFLVSQLLGWRELVSSGIVLRGNTTGALLYILSGLHLLHLLGGLIYNAVVLAQVKHMRADPVKSLLIFSSQYEHLKIKMLVTYWHFIDAIWVVLFIVFLFTI
jgi:cytochrome c oxidase subunit 3